MPQSTRLKVADYVSTVALMIGLGFLAASIVHCGPKDPSSYPIATEQGTCAEACSNLRALGCEEGKPTPRGAQCEEVCKHVAESQIGLWNLGCLAHAKVCASTGACYAGQP